MIGKTKHTSYKFGEENTLAKSQWLWVRLIYEINPEKKWTEYEI